MKRGHLSQFFSGVASKTLSSVETNPSASNQHEFNGVNGLITILGEVDGPAVRYPARFIYLNDDVDSTVSTDCEVSWYDSRRNHPTRTEYRLYFPRNDVMDLAAEGDLLVVGLRQDRSLLIAVVESGSTTANQIRWLFGLEESDTRYRIKSEEETDAIEVDFTGRWILEQLGFESTDTAPNHLEEMLRRFGGSFPTTRVFSAFARETLGDVSSANEPDKAILLWMEREEILFRTLERHIVANRLVQGFGDDVDMFVDFSLSVQNRRKCRAGYALENHLEAVFQDYQLRYSREKVTENRTKPDFVFPSIEAYHDATFPSEDLTMLGVKQTCKDRWRQVLSEASRIGRKHLLTLEPSISRNQTDEMLAHQLQLVVPTQIQSTYQPDQRHWLISLAEFISILRSRDSGTA